MSPESTLVVYAPQTGTAHRHDGDLEPACTDRLHNAEVDEWRLTKRCRADGDECGHPECFGGEQA